MVFPHPFGSPMWIESFISWSLWCREKQIGKPSRRKQNKCRRAYKKYMLSLGQRGV